MLAVLPCSDMAVLSMCSLFCQNGVTCRTVQFSPSHSHITLVCKQRIYVMLSRTTL